MSEPAVTGVVNALRRVLGDVALGKPDELVFAAAPRFIELFAQEREEARELRIAVRALQEAAEGAFDPITDVVRDGKVPDLTPSPVLMVNAVTRALNWIGPELKRNRNAIRVIRAALEMP